MVEGRVYSLMYPELDDRQLTERFAALVTTFCQAARPGERVLLGGDAVPAIAALAGSLGAAGAVPVLDVPAELRDDLLALTGAEDGSRAPSPVELWRGATGYVHVRTADYRAERLPDAEQAAEIRLLRMTKRKTTTYWPDETLAARAGMSLPELKAYYAHLLHLGDAEPARGFEELRDFQAGRIEALHRARRVRIVGDRTDLTLEVRGRGWENSYGRRNTPSGEMFTSPLEASADGTIHFDVPSYNFPERVRGVTLTLREGVVVDAGAEEGEETLLRRLDTDEGSRRLGELGIGGNRLMSRPLGSTLFDEKIAGTVHLALGASYPQTGGLNRSALHWDLIKDLRGGGTILLDGEPFQVDGRFV